MKKGITYLLFSLLILWVTVSCKTNKIVISDDDVPLLLMGNYYGLVSPDKTEDGRPAYDSYMRLEPDSIFYYYLSKYNRLTGVWKRDGQRLTLYGRLPFPENNQRRVSMMFGQKFFRKDTVEILITQDKLIPLDKILTINRELTPLVFSDSKKPVWLNDPEFWNERFEYFFQVGNAIERDDSLRFDALLDRMIEYDVSLYTPSVGNNLVIEAIDKMSPGCLNVLYNRKIGIYDNVSPNLSDFFLANPFRELLYTLYAPSPWINTRKEDPIIQKRMHELTKQMFKRPISDSEAEDLIRDFSRPK